MNEQEPLLLIPTHLKDVPRPVYEALHKENLSPHQLETIAFAFTIIKTHSENNQIADDTIEHVLDVVNEVKQKPAYDAKDIFEAVNSTLSEKARQASQNQ